LLAIGKHAEVALRYLSEHVQDMSKTYRTTVLLDARSDTDDADGTSVGEPSQMWPAPDVLEQALAGFRGTFEQRPPIHSAKKVSGQRAYELARQAKPVTLVPVPVTVRALTLLGPFEGDGKDIVRVEVTATAGFYVRALARDLGERLGCGAHLLALRRTRCAPFDISQAIPLEEAEALGPGLAGRLLSPADALPHLPAVRITELGLVRIRHGNAIGPDQLEGHALPPASTPGPIRLLAGDGQLVALGHSRGGALHPVVVLG
jgi:tRNA pseudouridine55 synthase